MAIDLATLPSLRWDQRWDQRWCGLDALSWSQKLRERRALRASPLECHQGRLLAIALRELPDPQQGRIDHRLKTQQERGLCMMQQGKVLLRMLRALGLHRVLQQGNDRAHTPVLLHPSFEEVDANKRQVGRNLDEMPLRRSFFFASLLGVVAPSLD